MQCPRCHAENREGRRFCGECGLSLALTCPSCRFVNEGGEKFCGGCGAPVASFTARASHQRGNEAHALRLLGQAEKPYREALALAEPRGMRPLVAHCHLGLAELYLRTGARKQAHQHLTTATTMYREMDMTYWLERAKVDRSGSS